jgi:cation diffusion facilitator CzcD-associated flavoprotein CzcO
MSEEEGGDGGARPATGSEAIDLDALKARYRQERDRRLRPDGDDQYIEIAGAHAHFERDPWAGEAHRREPLREDADVVVIGGGFGGLLVGARLRQLGVEDVRIVEKGVDFGGTWYWNRYPGVACDIESYVYMPLLEEVGTLPTEKYARGAEILEHCRRIGRQFDLYRGALFGTGVTGLRWDEASGHWRVETDRGDLLRARFVCMAIGFLEKPKLPGIPGIEDFEGAAFHTSRWDYAFTGGDANGNLDRLADKVVGVVGTGASAVQCVPHLGASAKQLYVFQRTPAGVDVRENRPTDLEWLKGQPRGWQQQRIDNFQVLTTGGAEEEDLVADRWTDVPHRMLEAIASEGRALSPQELEALAERVDFEKMSDLRAHIEAVVDDPSTAEALKPWYRQWCKRPCFHDEYLPTFNRPNVTLVDTLGRGVERITRRGVVANGREYPLDGIVFATGFEVATEFARRAGFETVGREGVTLTERWRDRYRTFHGLHVQGFPNCYVMSLAQSGFTLNFPYMIDIQARQIAYVISETMKRGADVAEATPEAVSEWCETLAERAASFDRSFAEQCTPSYYNKEGKPDEKSLDRNFFFGGPTEFAELLTAWREEGSMRGMELRSAGRPPGEGQEVVDGDSIS